MADGKLRGKIALVTGGGGSGIGHGISHALARAGAHVVIVEIDLNSAQATRQAIEAAGGSASVMKGDISEARQVESVIKEVVLKHQRLDVLVNSAGVGMVKPPAEVTEQEFDRIMAIDLRGLWLCCKYAIPQMQAQKNGSIVNVASVHSRATIPGFGIYAGLKAGVVGLTRGLAVQHGPDGIRANAVCPGLVDGEQTRRIIARLNPDVDGWFDDYVKRYQALPQLIQPQDIGETVAFLASEEARMITGAEIPVDAGTWAMLTGRD
jgi:NAD(P)-dependent dehydrogenase (short-subunit alcohol dehydrogenase family)